MYQVCFFSYIHLVLTIQTSLRLHFCRVLLIAFFYFLFPYVSLSYLHAHNPSTELIFLHLHPFLVFFFTSLCNTFNFALSSMFISLCILTCLYSSFLGSLQDLANKSLAVVWDLNLILSGLCRPPTYLPILIISLIYTSKFFPSFSTSLTSLSAGTLHVFFHNFAWLLLLFLFYAKNDRSLFLLHCASHQVFPLLYLLNSSFTFLISLWFYQY